MKRCPKCSADYFDNMIEFCLEDGAKLSDISDVKLGHPGIKKPIEQSSDAEIETIVKAFPDGERLNVQPVAEPAD